MSLVKTKYSEKRLKGLPSCKIEKAIVPAAASTSNDEGPSVQSLDVAYDEVLRLDDLLQSRISTDIKCQKDRRVRLQSIRAALSGSSTSVTAGEKREKSCDAAAGRTWKLDADSIFSEDFEVNTDDLSSLASDYFIKNDDQVKNPVQFELTGQSGSDSPNQIKVDVSRTDSISNDEFSLSDVDQDETDSSAVDQSYMRNLTGSFDEILGVVGIRGPVPDKAPNSNEQSKAKEFSVAETVAALKEGVEFFRKDQAFQFLVQENSDQRQSCIIKKRLSGLREELKSVHSRIHTLGRNDEDSDDSEISQALLKDIASTPVTSSEPATQLLRFGKTRKSEVWEDLSQPICHEIDSWVAWREALGKKYDAQCEQLLSDIPDNFQSSTEIISDVNEKMNDLKRLVKSTSSELDKVRMAAKANSG